MSKLIPAASAAPLDDIQSAPTVTAPVEVAITVPLDVRKAIEREAERDPSDPFLARRLAAHYRQGIWTPADAKAK
jgi:hypothetical protein